MDTSPLLSRNHWKTVKESRYEVALLPWGATEAHNYHLPYGTDIFEAELLARESAKIAREKTPGIVVLPPSLLASIPDSMTSHSTSTLIPAPR